MTTEIISNRTEDAPGVVSNRGRAWQSEARTSYLPLTPVPPKLPMPDPRAMPGPVPAGSTNSMDHTEDFGNVGPSDAVGDHTAAAVSVVSR